MTLYYTLLQHNGHELEVVVTNDKAEIVCLDCNAPILDAVKPVDSEIIELFTDGACQPNPGCGGWGVAVSINDRLYSKMYGGDPQTTNQRMELTAAIRALRYYHDELSGRDARVWIVTDSKYVRQGITSWIKSWKCNGWMTSSKRPVKNQDLWKRLDDLNRSSIQWRWTRGHSGDFFNELADDLAVTGAHASRREGAFEKIEVGP